MATYGHEKVLLDQWRHIKRIPLYTVDARTFSAILKLVNRNPNAGTRKEKKVKELDALNRNIKELNKHALLNDYDAFDILQIMKELRHNALAVEDNLMTLLFPKKESTN